jgi:hypothetical protein
LMKASLMYATSSFSERKSASSLLVSAAANVSAEKTLGSSTACVLTLDQSTGEFDYFFNFFYDCLFIIFLLCMRVTGAVR